MELGNAVTQSEVQNFSGLSANAHYYVMAVVKVGSSGSTLATFYTDGYTVSSGGDGLSPTTIISHTRNGTTISLKYSNPDNTAEYMYLLASDDGTNFNMIADCYSNDSPNEYGHPETVLNIRRGTYTCTVYTSNVEPRWFQFWRMSPDDDAESPIYYVDKSVQNSFAWTSSERSALTNKGSFDIISASRFTELIDAVRIMLEGLGFLQDIIPYATINSQNMMKDGTNSRTVDNLTRSCKSSIVSGGSLPATVFNTIKYCINSYLSPSGVNTVFNSGDLIYGSYFIDIVAAMDAAAS